LGTLAADGSGGSDPARCCPDEGLYRKKFDKPSAFLQRSVAKRLMGKLTGISP
jgi:hypothetical protein